MTSNIFISPSYKKSQQIISNTKQESCNAKNIFQLTQKSAQKANKYLSHGEHNAIKWYKKRWFRNEKWKRLIKNLKYENIYQFFISKIPFLCSLQIIYEEINKFYCKKLFAIKCAYWLVIPLAKSYFLCGDLLCVIFKLLSWDYSSESVVSRRREYGQIF